MSFVVQNGIQLKIGPIDNRITFKLQLPLQKRLGVLVSGGIDSAILYWMLTKISHDTGFIHSVQPYSIPRKEGSKIFAPLVNEYVNNYFGIKKELIIVGDVSLEDHKQVTSGMKDVLEKYKEQVVYTGAIKVLDIHAINITIPVIRENAISKAPMVLLDKSQVIDLVVQLEQEELFKITHACNTHESGRCYACNGCNERTWGFEQLGITDPGID